MKNTFGWAMRTWSASPNRAKETISGHGVTQAIPDSRQNCWKSHAPSWNITKRRWEFCENCRPVIILTLILLIAVVGGPMGARKRSASKYVSITWLETMTGITTWKGKLLTVSVRKSLMPWACAIRHLHSRLICVNPILAFYG